MHDRALAPTVRYVDARPPAPAPARCEVRPLAHDVVEALGLVVGALAGTVVGEVERRARDVWALVAGPPISRARSR